MIDSILIVEDQPDVCDWVLGFAREVFPGANFRVAANLTQALTQLGPLPDLLLTDLSLPDGRGNELITRIKRINSSIPCVVITSFEDDDHLFPALKAGADGYLLKDQPELELKNLLAGIVSGKPPLSPVIAQRMFEFFREPAGEGLEVRLTSRETETLTLISRGYSAKECARFMSISHHTVAGYVKEVYRKLQVNSRAEVALEAARLGLN